MTLNEIQKQRQIPKNSPLSYTLFVFENYPIGQAEQTAEKSLVAKNISAAGKTNYPLMLVIEPTNYLHIQDVYDVDCFDEAAIKLIAYYVLANESITTEMIRQHMSKQLLDYMIPSYFVVLDALPLNPNGKIDRNRLPPLDVSQLNFSEPYVAPITKTEEKFVKILTGLLKLDKISTHAHFFDIGGDSLLAVRYKFKIDKELSTDIPLSILFKYPTIAGLVKYIEANIITAEADLNLYEIVEF